MMAEIVLIATFCTFVVIWIMWIVVGVSYLGIDMKRIERKLDKMGKDQEAETEKAERTLLERLEAKYGRKSK